MTVLASVNSTFTDLMTSVFSSAIAGKVWFATAAVVLALVQVSTGARIFGKLQRVVPIGYPTLGRVHRWSGRIAILCTLPVAFHCIFIIGFETSNARVFAHSLLGSFLYGAVAVKLCFVRDHALPGWVLPVAGGGLFTVLVALWSTSALWYLTEVRFGF
jgi:hypothetical protein